MKPGATHYVKQHSLCQIIGGVANGYGGSANAVGHVCQKPVSHLPGSLLERRDAVFALVGDGVLLCHAEGKAQFLSHCFHKSGVFVGLLARKSWLR